MFRDIINAIWKTRLDEAYSCMGSSLFQYYFPLLNRYSCHEEYTVRSKVNS